MKGFSSGSFDFIFKEARSCVEVGEQGIRRLKILEKVCNCCQKWNKVE